ncbi:MAG TPA: hypothetical protein VNM67_03130 [Thermoanaerobaculia bacterium]|nr:hypothetical protein [Thermoanaerobaculia bacterium]
MRNVRFQPLLLALFLGLSAFGMGCRQSEEPERGQVSVEQDREAAQTGEEPGLVREDPELQPEERIVVVEPEIGEDAGARQDLDDREQRLAERNAELDARERRLREQDATERQALLKAREREQAAREPERQARVPEPAPERQARIPKPAPQKAPAPTPRVEREEPVKAERTERTEKVAESRRPDTRDERDEDAEREAAELEQERQARAREEREARDRSDREEQARRERERGEAEREREREREAQRPAPLMIVNVPAGTVMEIELVEGLSSQTSEAGDIFRARVASDVSSDGAVGIPSGSEIVGVVTEAVPLGKVGGRAKLGLKFTDLILPSGKAVPIDASLVQQGGNETRRDAATIGGAAAGGAILGRVLSKKDRSRGAVIGAIIGAAAGAVLASRNGEEVVIPGGTRLALKLDDEVEVRTARQARR